MAHPVRVDEENIMAAFQAAEAGAAPSAAQAAGVPMPAEQAGTGGAEWFPITRVLAATLAIKYFPAWQVGADVQEQWADALGGCLDQLMPGGLGNIDAWGPWGKLAYCTSLWVMAGIDLETMSLKPRTFEEIEVKDTSGNAAPVAASPGQQKPQPGGFKTDG